MTRQALTVDDLAEMTGIAPRTIRQRIQQHGHFMGVAPVPDTGKRLIFSRAKVDRVLGIEPEGKAS